eukprot:s3413_g7.t1
MSDWTQRLMRLQALMPPAAEESVDHFTLEDLKATPMSFGKAHVGRSFETIWSGHPDWIKWFLRHYKTSPKFEHKKMIRFIQLRIEEAEKNEGTTASAQIGARPKSVPKAAAAKAKSLSAPSTHWQLPVDPEIDATDLIFE